IRSMTDDDRVFKALADPTRRFLLDRLFQRDGRTLTELESELAMTRFGVMKHLKVLEHAGLVVTRRQGREKHHFLNPVPIRLVHDRWVSKYAEPWAAALTGLKRTLEEDLMEKVFEIYIKTTPERLLEVEPPRRLVQTFTALWSDEVRSEGASRVTWEIEPVGDSCRLTVTHDELREGANDELYGGWPMILSGLKTLLETGERLTTPGSLIYA